MWIAAVIDCEGCISFDRHKRPQGVHDRLWLRVVNTDVRLVNRLRVLAGGRISPPRMTRKSTRPFWEWYATTGLAKEILAAIKPYLVAKQEQAEVALEFVPIYRKGEFSRRLTVEEDTHRNEIKRRLSLLKRGVEEAV